MLVRRGEGGEGGGGGEERDGPDDGAEVAQFPVGEELAELLEQRLLVGKGGLGVQVVVVWHATVAIGSWLGRAKVDRRREVGEEICTQMAGGWMGL